MRVSIVLAICFLGVASASILTKRSFLGDFQNKSQEAFQNLEHFGQDFQQKLQDALKNLFGNKNATENVAKRAVNPLELVNDLGNPAKFAQDLAGVLADMALNGRRKRDLPGDALQLLNDLDNPAKFAQDFVKVLAEMALQGRRKRETYEEIIAEFGEKKVKDAYITVMGKVFAVLNGSVPADAEAIELVESVRDPVKFAEQLLKTLHEMEATSGATLTKRDLASETLALVNTLGDPAAFAQQLLKVMADMALQGRRKRDLAEDLRKFADAGKQKAQDALKKIMALFSSFKHGAASDETSTEKTVSKRDVSEDLQKIAAAGKEKVEAALKQLQAIFEQVKGGFNHDESSTTVTKRDIAESLKQFSQSAQEKTQAAFQHLKDAFSNLFKGMKKPTQEVEEEVSTEVSVSKRSLGDFQQKAHESMSGFRDAVTNFFNQFRKPHKPAPKVDEDTTESS